MKNPRLIDLSGHRFGAWLVTSQDGNTANGAALWKCRCDCGNESRVIGRDLRAGKSTSCGCVPNARFGSLRRTHGGSGTRLHRIWKNIRARCSRPTYPEFEYYGGRGITICPEWASYEGFRAWALSSGYQDGLSIERKDVNGNYSPSNCTWATALEQSINRRFVKKAPDGRPWLHVAAANGVSRDAFYMRVRNGWPIERAAALPMGSRRPTESL